MGLLNCYEPATNEKALAKRMLEVLANSFSEDRLKELSEIIGVR